MDVLTIAASLATVFNARTKGFRDCRVSDDALGLCYVFDTTKDAEAFQQKRARVLEGKPISVYSIGAEVYEYFKYDAATMLRG